MMFNKHLQHSKPPPGPIQVIALTVFVGASVCLSSVAQASEPLLTPKTIEAVANHLVGTMDTSLQAQADANFVNVRMTTCTIIPTEPAPNSVYLYQEQALSHKLDQPYRQRFLQLTLSADQTRVESRTFKPEETTELIGFCQDPQVISSNALGMKVCAVALRPSALGFVGSTPQEGCPVTMRGATRLTNVVVLHSDGMDTWDRGFDESGQQLWGAKTEPYRYRWLSRE